MYRQNDRWNYLCKTRERLKREDSVNLGFEISRSQLKECREDF